METKARSGLALLIVPLISMNTAIADDVCDIALTSGAFNTSDYAQSSRLLLKKKDDVCKTDYNTQSEAESAGKQSGGSIGYGGLSLGLSDAKQTSGEKWSIADSEFCRASAEELDSFTSTIVKQQVADVALRAWSECIDKTNKLYVKYSLSPDGTGMTGTIYRSVSLDSGFGNITGVMSSDPKVDVNCHIGTKPIEVNKARSIRIDKGKIGISCNKSADVSVRIALNTDVGDQEWISIPSRAEQKQSTIEAANDAINQLRKQIASLNEQITKNRQESNSYINNLTNRVNNTQARIGGIALTITRNPALFDIAATGEEKNCGGNDVVYGFRTALNNNQALDMWRCATINLAIPPGN